MRVVLYLGGEQYRAFFVRGVSIHFEGYSEDFMYFSFLSLQLHYPLVHRSCDHLFMTYIVFIFIYMMMYVFLHLSLHVLLLSLFIHMFFYVYNLYFCFTLRCLDEFCLNCFRKTGCENLSCHELSSYKFFQEFVLGLDFSFS